MSSSVPRRRRGTLASAKMRSSGPWRHQSMDTLGSIDRPRARWRSLECPAGPPFQRENPRQLVDARLCRPTVRLEIAWVPTLEEPWMLMTAAPGRRKWA